MGELAELATSREGDKVICRQGKWLSGYLAGRVA